LHRGSWATKDFTDYQMDRDLSTDRFRSSVHLQDKLESTRSIARFSPRPSLESFRNSGPPSQAGILDESSTSPGAISSTDASPHEQTAEFVSTEALLRDALKDSVPPSPTRPVSSPSRPASVGTNKRGARLHRRTGSLRDKDIDEGRQWDSLRPPSS